MGGGNPLKRMFLVYNPASGKSTFKNKLDYVIDKFQKKDYLVTPYRLSLDESAYDVMKKIDPSHYDLIVASGGDGTLNSVVTGMINHGIKLPLGIIPSGTSNDFANHLGIKGGLDQYLNKIIQGNHKNVDIGSVNGNLFVNVVSMGNLASIAHNTNTVIKNNLGKLGYYINVLGQYPVFQPFNIKLTVDDREYVENALLFFVLNSSCAGGFKSLAPLAKVDDGKFDVVVIKNCKLVEKMSLFIKVLKGEHQDDNCVLYLQTSKLRVECSDEVETDIDGEKGPSFPLDIECLNKVKVFC